MELSFYSLDSSNLTKAQLAEILFEQLGLNKREAKDFIDAFFEIISAQLADGQDVRISGFGSYEVQTKSTRHGRNPRTGEPVQIKPRRVATFRASSQLKQQLKQPLEKT
jgi:integration host factor subunit alpha